jgi:MerR family copper efflux transcriptional regulator
MVMRIGELARRTKLPTSRIRFYEAKGLLPKVQRGADGYRDFPNNVAVTLRWIAIAQELGFSLREIHASLSEENENLPSKPDMLESLRTKLTSVDENIEKLSRRRTLMAALIDGIEVEG